VEKARYFFCTILRELNFAWQNLDLLVQGGERIVRGSRMVKDKSEREIYV